VPNSINTVTAQDATLIDAEAVEPDSTHAPTALSPANVAVPPTALQSSRSESPDTLTPEQAAEALQLALDPKADSTADQIFDEFGPGKQTKGIKVRELSHYEQMLVLELYYKKKFNQCKVAAILHCHQATISRVLAKYADTSVLAKRTLSAGAQQMAERVVKDAKPKELIKVLKGIKTPDGIRVLEPERDYGAGHGGQPVNPIYVGVKVEID
jgi:hypothetical protein